MADMEKAIKSILVADATVLALVSTRVYPNWVPQGASMPAISFNQVSGIRDYSMDGADGMAQTLYQIDCWATTYSETRDLADAVRGALSAYSGTIAGVTIDVAFLQDENDVPEYSKQSDVAKRYGKSLDFTIWFRE